MKFSKTAQPKNKIGRPKGSRNKRSLISDQLHDDALKQLTQAISKGESWAITAILDRTMPKLKNITPNDSLDGEMLRAQITALTEIEDRLIALEEAVKHE